jgi:NDP-sugar pyrophosphorylase family protein
MKKLFLFVTAIFLTTGPFAQEKFIVPEVTIEQKYQTMLYHIDLIVATSINYAKMQGLTATEYGTTVGEQFKYTWDRDAGFDGNVKGMLYNMACFMAEPDIEITTNTTEKVEFKTRLMGALIKENEPVYGVTYKEYMDFWKAVINTIGDYLGAKSEISYDNEWMYFSYLRK